MGGRQPFAFLIRRIQDSETGSSGVGSTAIVIFYLRAVPVLFALDRGYQQ
jgi:hypothetical protein